MTLETDRLTRNSTDNGQNAFPSPTSTHRMNQWLQERPLRYRITQTWRMLRQRILLFLLSCSILLGNESLLIRSQIFLHAHPAAVYVLGDGYPTVVEHPTCICKALDVALQVERATPHWQRRNLRCGAKADHRVAYRAPSK